MKRFVKQQRNFSFPYVVDETQEVARTYDAVCTPEFSASTPTWSSSIAAGSMRRGRRSSPMPAANCSRRVPDRRDRQGCSIK
jgi:hypothetical protein